MDNVETLSNAVSAVGFLKNIIDLYLNRTNTAEQLSNELSFF